MLNIVLCGQAVTGASLHDRPLAEALLSRGHRLTVLSGAAARASFAGLELDFIATPEREMPPLSTRLPPLFARAQAVRRRALTLLVEPLEEQWRILNATLQRRAVDIVIGDAFFLGLAVLARIPRAERPAVLTLGHFPLLFPDPQVAPFGLGIQPSVGQSNRALAGAMRIAGARAYGWLSRDYRTIARRLTGIEPVQDIRLAYETADAWAQLSVPRFEYSRARTPVNLSFVGPLHPGTEPPLPDWWDPMAEPPVVVVQHAVNAEIRDLVIPTICALEDAVVTVLVIGAVRKEVEAALARPLPPNVHFEPAAPWSRLSPGRAIVVSTGDYVEVQHALRFGLPVVAAGTFEPDVETAARVAWSGAGIDLRTRQPSREALHDAVLRALHDGNMRRNAARIAAQIATTNAEETICDLAEALAGRI